LQNDNILNLFQELKNHKNQLRAIFENTRHSIILLDVEGKLLFFNNIAKQNVQIFYKKELEYGEIFSNYGRTKDEQVRLADRLKRALMGESFVFDEDIFHEQFESSVWFRIEYDPVYEEQRLIGVAILMTDISAMKRATKRIENQNQTLREIAFLQSHRVRRPLANILGLISVFNRKNMSDPFNHLVLEKLLFSTQELDEIIRSIVDKTYGVD
jgi:PAS domain S-box-containing protein